MTQLSEIYNQRILELSANIAGAQRLADADATATAHSKLCGSTVTVDLKVEGDRVEAFGQTVKACLLGQAAASVMGRNIVGTSAEEVRAQSAARCAGCSKRAGRHRRVAGRTLACAELVKDYRSTTRLRAAGVRQVKAALAKVEAGLGFVGGGAGLGQRVLQGRSCRAGMVAVGKAGQNLGAPYSSLTLKPLIGWECRHLPTCSQYALEAIDRNGASARAAWLWLRRASPLPPLGDAPANPVPRT
jgi:NifU-like protein involved in Fe-S cluster formation